MLSGALKENVIEEGQTKEEFTKRKRDARKKTLHEGKLQGQFVEKTRNIAHKFSGKWIRNGFLKKETEGMLFAAQKQALRTNLIKGKIDKQPFENDEVELYWDLTIKIDLAVSHNRPDNFLVEMAIRKWTIIDAALPGDFNVARREDWKVEKYQDIAIEVKRIHHIERHSTSCEWSSRNGTKVTHQVNFRLLDGTVRNSRNTTQGDLLLYIIFSGSCQKWIKCKCNFKQGI